MNAYLHQASFSEAQVNGSSHRSEHPAIGRLASLVNEVAMQLEDAPRGSLPAVAECNAVLEGCLEAQRATGERETSAASARDDLRRLARLLTVVDEADVALVLRQIRRVLGRFDAQIA